MFVTHPAQRRGHARHGRQAGPRGRAQDRRDRARCCYRSPGVFKEYYKNRDGDRRRQDGRTAGCIPATPGYLDERRAPDASSTAPRMSAQLERRHAVRAEIHREQAEVLPLHQRGGGVRPRPRLRRRASSTSTSTAVGDWAERRNIAYASYQELARATRVYDLMQGDCIERVNRDLAADPRMAGVADPPLPDPAQGARRRRRRADAHPQGAPRLHRRALRGAGRGALRRREDRPHRGRGHLRGRPQGHDRGPTSRSATSRPHRRGIAAPRACRRCAKAS